MHSVTFPNWTINKITLIHIIFIVQNVSVNNKLHVSAQTAIVNLSIKTTMNYKEHVPYCYTINIVVFDGKLVN
jgi:hypothetical protein